MKVLLTLMVKNESRILKRCIEAGALYSDSILVCDTGSTDNTVEIAKGLGAHVVGHEWKNFGHNRSLSFLAAVERAKELGWDLSKSYSLTVDADMVLRGERPGLSGTPGYRILQKHGSLEYYNTRFLRLDFPWKCVGVTHEYWDGGDMENLKELWIDDIGDGGSKSDKYTRDVRLLTKGLEEDPTNGRYMFYLAQSYKDVAKYTDAISWYKRRIRVGGWVEELWYSHYMMAKCHLKLGNLLKMELWGQRAIAIRKTRNEVILMMVAAFREKGDNFKAWHYLQLAEGNRKTSDILFVEADTYGPLLLYERSILQYYVTSDRASGARTSIEYLNSSHWVFFETVFANLPFYCKPIQADWKRLTFPVDEPFTTSSIAVNSDGTLNVRAVDYRMDSKGDYIYHNNGVRTLNFKSEWDPIGRIWNGFTILPDPDLPRRDVWILGLEDIRLYGNQFTATTREFSYNDSNRMVFGTYSDMACKVIHPPTETDCEKNWIPIGGNRVIYQWYPFQIGEINTDQLQITQTHQVPHIFSKMRGSSPPFQVGDRLWCLVHLVKPGNPRTYIHSWVVFDRNFKPVAYSPPFQLVGRSIEYSVGVQCWNGEIHIFASTWDSESWNGVISVSECVKTLIPISGS